MPRRIAFPSLLSAVLLATMTLSVLPSSVAAAPHGRQALHPSVLASSSDGEEAARDDGQEAAPGVQTPTPTPPPVYAPLAPLGSGGSQHPGRGEGDAPEAEHQSVSGQGTKSSPSGLTLGQDTSEAAGSAHDQGQSGADLAEIIHTLQARFKPGAHGMTVTEKVYETVTGSVYGDGKDQAGPTGGGGGLTSPAQGHRREHFDDMSRAPWAASSVAALFDAGVVTGTSATTFSPDASVTGAELLTMLARLQQWSPPPASATSSPFLKNSPTYAKEAVASALSKGILQGVGDLTDPNSGLTRAQAVTLIIHVLGLDHEAEALSTAPVGLSGPVPAWAHGAVALAVKLGLLKGSSGQVLAGAVLSRAQMAVLLARLAALEAGLTVPSQGAPS